MIADLSTRHEPILDLFRRHQHAAARQRYRLSDGQLAQFERDGFLAGIPVLDDDEVDQLCDELWQLMDPQAPGHELFYEYHSNESPDPNQVLFHALGHWRITPGFHDLLWHPGITVPAAQILGGAVRFWHDQLFCKPARHGGVVAWHQDYSYWTRTRPMAHLTVWIALDDSRRDNGCIAYLPGSHRWDLLPITGLAGDMMAIEQVLSPQQRRVFDSPVYAEMPRGHAAFHHPLIVHGSDANRTDRPRRAAVVNVMRDGVCSASDQPLLEGVPPIPAGSPVQGQFFPLLYAPATEAA